MKFEPKTKEEAKALLEKSYQSGWSRLELVLCWFPFLYFLMWLAVSSMALVAVYFIFGPIIGAVCSFVLAVIAFAGSWGFAVDCFKFLLENVDQVPISDKSREKVRAIMDVKPETASSTP